MRTLILLIALSLSACAKPEAVQPQSSSAPEPALPPSTPAPQPAPPPAPEPARPSTVSVSHFAAYSNIMPAVVGPGMAARSDSRITVWSLDVEGSEPAVVEQAVLTVHTDPPVTLRIEVDSPRVDPKGGKVSVQQRAKAYEGPRFAQGTNVCKDKPKTELTLTVRIGSGLKTLKAQGEYFCAG